MTGLDIVLVFAVILFARLGARLVSKYIKMKKEDEGKKKTRLKVSFFNIKTHNCFKYNTQ